MARRRAILVFGVLSVAAIGTARLGAWDDKGVQKDIVSIHIREVNPPAGKIGDTFIAKGTDLNASSVKELWLTNGKEDFKVVILQQSDSVIRFKVPETVPAGKLRLVVLDEFGMLLEQPAFVEVREAVRPTTG